MSHAPRLDTILLPTPADAANIGGLDDGDWIFIQGPGPQRGYYTFIPGVPPPGAILAPGGWLSPFTGGGGGSSPFSSIVYRPGGVSGVNVYATWAEVMAAFNALSGLVRIGIDDSIVSPAVVSADSDLQARAVFVPARQQSPLVAPPTLTVADGRQILNPAGVDGFVRLLANSTVVRPIAFSAGAAHLFELSNGARFENAGATPAFQIAGADQLVLTAFGGSYVTSTGPASVIDLAGTAVLRLFAFDGTTFASPNVVTGAAGTSLFFARDATVPPLSFAPPFGGTFAEFLEDKAAGVAYDDALVVPPIFGNTVQSALDYLKTHSLGVWPASDTVFAVDSAADATKLLRCDLSGQGAGTTTTLTTTATVSRPFRLPDISGTAVVQQDVTGFTFLGQTASDNGSNARLQLSSLIANGAQFRSNQYGANAGNPGISTFKSRAPTVGSPLGVVGSGCLAGDVLFSVTAVGVTPNTLNIPIAGLIRLLIPSSFVPAAQNYVPTEFDIQLVPMAGPINGRRISFKVTSEGVAETLRGVRAGGPNTLPATIDTGALWSSGTAAPNGTIVGSVGDLYTENTGTPGGVLWVKESGAATNTGWNAAQTNGSLPFGGVLYVNLNAPAGGNGSALAPFNTITDALNAIPGVPSRLNRWNILLGPGYYNEAIALRPWAFLIGADAFTTRLNGAANSMTLPAALWNPTGSADPNVTDTRAGFQSVTIVNAQTFDFNTGPVNPPPGPPYSGSNEGKLYFTDVISNSLLTFIAYSTINQTQHRHCQLFGGISQQGMQIQFEETAITGHGLPGTSPIIIADLPDAPAVFVAFGGGTNGDVSVTSTNPLRGASVEMRGFAVGGSLAINGVTTSYQSSPNGIPKIVTLGGGAPSPTTFNGGTAVGYDNALVSPALSGNPTNLQSAIDAIKSMLVPVTSVVPSKGGKPANMGVSPAGNLWMACFGSGGSPSKPYRIEAYDITTDPARPKLLSSTGSPTFAWFNVEQLVFRGTVMFAAAHPVVSGIYAVDISNPIAPANLGSYAGGAPSYDLALSSDGNTAALPLSSGAGGVAFVNVTNPAAMALLSTVGAPNAFVSVETSLWPIVYATDITTGTLRIYDATVPAAPLTLGTLAIDTNIRRMVADGPNKKLYIASTTDQLIYVVDIANNAAPTLLTTIPCGIFGDDTPVHLSLSVVGGRTILLVPMGGQDVNPGSIQSFDVTVPASPKFLRNFYVGQNVSDAQTVGSYIYASNRGGAQELITIQSSMLLNP